MRTFFVSEKKVQICTLQPSSADDMMINFCKLAARSMKMGRARTRVSISFYLWGEDDFIMGGGWPVSKFTHTATSLEKKI